LSSDDNNNNNRHHLIRSSSLTNQHLKNNFIQPTINIDEIDDIKQQDELSNNDQIPIIEASKCNSSSKQTSQMASPALSISSQSSARVITLLNHEVIQLPVYLEHEALITHNFDQLGKNKEELIEI
jgi:hypothetical protein